MRPRARPASVVGSGDASVLGSGDAIPREQRKRVDVDALRSLLGPEGPELGCEQCFEALDRYVELELSGADVDAYLPRMRAHLEGCGACDEDHRSLRALIETEIAPAKPAPCG